MGVDMTRIAIYDTTLRDGSQGEGVNFSLQDKLLITQRLDELGVDYIEGGYPLSNPKDAAYFRNVRDLHLAFAKVSAFGMTRRANCAPEDDTGMRTLVGAGTDVVTVVGKSWDLHAREVLGVSLDENVRMIADSVAYLAANVKEVVYDAEHFFDGYKKNPDYALRTLKAASESGANCLVLCDTNGGSLPHEIASAIEAVKREVSTPIGIHVHNDGDLAVANTLAAIEHGSTHIQGTINGIGERCGNVDLCSVIANLALKYQGYDLLRPGSLAHLTEVSRYVYEIANMNLRPGQPFVGSSAFAHKGGMHVHAVRKTASSYEHIDPTSVGNERRVLISELSGKSNIAEKLGEHGLESDPTLMARVLDRVQDLENEGYQFEAAEASFLLLVEKLSGQYRPRFERLGYRVTVENGPDGDPSPRPPSSSASATPSSTPSARATAPSTPSTAPSARPSPPTSPASPTCTSSTTRSASSTPAPAPPPASASSSKARTPPPSGAPSASPKTSSKPPGSPSSTPSNTKSPATPEPRPRLLQWPPRPRDDMTIRNWFMRVALRNPDAPDGRRFWSLTVGREYEVLGISGDNYRLLDDKGEPILFDPACFEVTDAREPAFWVSEHGEEGERYAHPPGWGVPGFFEDWHDGNVTTRHIFAAQLAHWYPGVPVPSVHRHTKPGLS